MRRKITMLFAALLACVGVVKADVTDLPEITTDLENPIYYTIMNTRSSQPGGLMYWAGDNVGMKDEQTVVLEDKHKFFFTGSHDAMYVHNAATGKKLATIGNGDKTAGSWTDEGTEWAVGVSPMGGGLAFGPKGGLNGNGCWNECNYTTPADKPDFTTWSANDAGSIFIVDLVEDYVFPVSDLFYVIECPLFEKVQGVKKAIYVNNEGKAVWGTEDLGNNNFYWIPTVKDGKVALKNLGTNKYLSKADGTMTEEVAEATLKILGDCSFNINIGGTIHAADHGEGKGSGSYLTGWAGGIGSASQWRFVQKNDPNALAEVVVNYSFTYGGEEKYTQEAITTFVGEEWPSITVSFPYGVSAAKPTGVIAAEDVVDGVVAKTIELSVAELPFVAAANNNSIENWYYINIHTNPKNTAFLQYTDDNTYIACELKGQVAVDNKDAYTWAFVGNIFDGFKLVNKQAGIEQAVNSNGSSAPVLGDYATGVNWQMIVSRTNNAAQYFCFEYPNGDCLNAPTSGQLSFWWDNDNGSTMWVTLRDDAASLQALVDAAEASLAAWNYTGVGYVTASAEDKAAISEAVVAAKTAIANKTGYDAAQAALEGAVAAAKTYTIQPVAGKFYTIVSSCTDDHRAGQEVYVNIDGGMQFAKVGEVASEIARVFQFVPANDGKFYLFNIEKGAYMQSVGTATEIDATKAKPVAITNLGAANIVKIVPDGQNMMHAQDAGSKIVGWNNNSTTNGSAWKIVETELSLNDLTHTLDVSEAGWATLVLGYNAEIPTGVKVYAVSAINDGSVTLAEVEDGLPAHTPVLIEAAEGKYVFNYTAEAEAVENNLLAGSVFNVTVEGLGYILGNGSQGVGLYRAKKTISTDNTNDGEEGTEDDTYEAFKNNAHKAYLPVAEGDAAPAMFSFGRGEGTTGIDNAQLTIDNVVIYDLTGRRVEKMEKGIYIVNGKKVVIR